MPVAVFDRKNPQRTNSSAKWWEQIREDQLRLEPGHPEQPLDHGDFVAACRAAGVHETKLPERGLAHLCRNCRKATRDSLWLCRCGPCGERWSPLLVVFTACDLCGGPEEALQQLRQHIARAHQPARDAGCSPPASEG